MWVVRHVNPNFLYENLMRMIFLKTKSEMFFRGTLMYQSNLRFSSLSPHPAPCVALCCGCAMCCPLLWLPVGTLNCNGNFVQRFLLSECWFLINGRAWYVLQNIFEQNCNVFMMLHLEKGFHVRNGFDVTTKNPTIIITFC